MAPGWVELIDLINRRWIIWAPSVVAISSSTEGQCTVIFNSSQTVHAKASLDDLVKSIDSAVKAAQEWEDKHAQ